MRRNTDHNPNYFVIDLCFAAFNLCFIIGLVCLMIFTPWTLASWFVLVSTLFLFGATVMLIGSAFHWRATKRYLAQMNADTLDALDRLKR